MSFRMGILIGLAVGYVLGARAGVERYEQLRRRVATVRRHPALAQLTHDGVGFTDAVRLGLATGLESGSRLLRRRSG